VISSPSQFHYTTASAVALGRGGVIIKLEAKLNRQINFLKGGSMLIGSAAEVLNVSESSIRRWERQGVIPPAPKRPTGFRDYGERDIETIKDYLKKRNGNLNK
jgi:hypothetical protein